MSGAIGRLSRVRDAVASVGGMTAPNPLKTIAAGGLAQLIRFFPYQVVIGSILNDAFFQKGQRWGFHMLVLFVAGAAEFARMIGSVSTSPGPSFNAEQVKNGMFFGSAFKGAEGEELIAKYFSFQAVMPVIILMGFFVGYAATSLAILQNSPTTDENIPTLNIWAIITRIVVIFGIAVLVGVFHQRSIPNPSMAMIVVNMLIGAVAGQFGGNIVSAGGNYSALMFQDNTDTNMNRMCVAPTITE